VKKSNSVHNALVSDAKFLIVTLPIPHINLCIVSIQFPNGMKMKMTWMKMKFKRGLAHTFFTMVLIQINVGRMTLMLTKKVKVLIRRALFQEMSFSHLSKSHL